MNRSDLNRSDLAGGELRIDESALNGVAAATKNQKTRFAPVPASLRAELEEFMRQEGIDLWICPAAIGPAPEGLTNTGDTAMNVPWSYAGMPVLSLPAGRATNGLPLAVQVVAPALADEQLVAWAEPMAGVLAGASTLVH